MAKLNEGDVMEGIFAISLAQLFAYGMIDKGRLNSVRSRVEPAMFQTGRYTTVIRQFSEGSPKDNIKVTLNVRLKYQSTMSAFGPNYEVLMEKGSDVGNISQKIDTLVRYTNTNYSQRIQRVKDSYLKNNKSDKVDIVITADGIAGESSGGLIKGDLDVVVTVNGQEYMDERLNFSVKSESKTLANLSPFNGMMDILNRFSITLPKEQEYRQILGETLARAKTPREKQLKVSTIKDLYADVTRELSQLNSSPAMIAQTFKLFRDVTFGDDLADVVDFRKTKVKEITVNHINELQKNTLSVDATPNGDNIIFKLQPGNKKLFQLRFKNRSGEINGEFNIDELKFYVEAGDAAYVK